MTAKRMVLKLTDEQLAWVEQAAADEGIDSATFVRMMIDRLSKGRAPLISQMVAVEAMPEQYPVSAATAAAVRSFVAPSEFAAQFSDLATADPAAVRAALDREPAKEFVVDWEASKAVAAISLRSVEWDRYNPLPK
jgi:hypothetical protein